MFDKEILKSLILRHRDMVKDIEKHGGSCEALKREVKSLEDTYRYHYEGGNRPSHLPSSSNNSWVGCHKCDWERQLNDNENENSLYSSCENCHKNELYFYPSTDRKRRSSNSWVDSSKETLGGGGVKTPLGMERIIFFG